MPVLSPGDELGHYEVISLLGEGGMGEVYKALDTRLKRQVAVKVLSRAHIGDSEARQRFLREARVVSALQHPNILVIHDLLAIEGVDVIVTELLEGQTLGKVIAAAPGGLPPLQVAGYAVQVAAAVAKAHASGVLHRDLKPSNIMVLPDGLVKVLDFGLAKFSAPAQDDQLTLTDLYPTRAGTMLGTCAYMSPEQAQGLVVDERSDIFSFGIIAYEMLTGRRAFFRGNVASTLAAVLRDDLDWSGATGELVTVVSQCLRKDPKHRYSSMTEVMEALRSAAAPDSALISSFSKPPVPALKPTRSRRLAIGLAAAAAALLAVIAFVLLPTREIPVKPVVVPITTDAKSKNSPAISPDGDLVAFLSTEAETQLFVQPVGPGRPIRLTDNPIAAVRPAWSPDGKSVAFASLEPGSRGIHATPALGGPERNLIPTEENVAGIDWSPDGKWLAVSMRKGQSADAIWLIDPETRERRQLSQPPSGTLGDLFPTFSPDGKQLAFIRRFGVASHDIMAVETSGGEPRRITREALPLFGLTWTRNGRHLVFSSRRTVPSRLWRIPATGGEPVLLAEAGEGSIAPHLSRAADRLVYLNRLRDVNLWRIELDSHGRAATMPRSWIASTYIEAAVDYSPDGKLIAFDSQRTGHSEIWICDPDGGNPLQLTRFNGPHTAHPSFSPDGNWIALDSRAQGQADIYVIHSNGGEPRRLTSNSKDEVMPSWSRDGKWIYYVERGAGVRIHRIPAAGGASTYIADGIRPRESSDGRHLYYLKSGTGLIWRRPVAGGDEEKVAGRLGPGVNRLWTVGTLGVYYFTSTREVEALLFAGNNRIPIARLSAPAPGDEGTIALSPDGRALLYPQQDLLQTDVVMLDRFR